ncbi:MULTISPECIES: hypothetical protein [Chelativorans]|mgnify:CR=1 FL=1|jgi:hypothetical protein|uniref:Conserved hypothetical signal peptide protein n=1 Tax=Chelativorans sp. (strain BNC1) TaxID=266779 RepID=Q11I02_CHESB|nr:MULTISPECIES: hypothetical protein [Chelativorans]
MPHLANLYFKTAIVFLLVGIAMGLQMAISGDHNVIGPHAHANLLGWVTMAIFGSYYALNPAKAQGRLAMLQYWVYTAGVVVIVPSLYMLYLGYAFFEPLTAIASLVILLGVVLFAVVIYAKEPAPRSIPGGAAV